MADTLAVQAISRAHEEEPSDYLVKLRGLLRGATLLHTLRSDLPPPEWDRKRRYLEDRADELLQQTTPPLGAAKVAERIRKRRHLFTFMDDPSLEATNNRAERSLPAAVIARKLSCGNKTPRGKQTWEILTSLAETCHQRGQNFVESEGSPGTWRAATGRGTPGETTGRGCLWGIDGEQRKTWASAEGICHAEGNHDRHRPTDGRTGEGYRADCGGRTPEVRRAGRCDAARANVARTWLDKVEAILADRLANRPHDAEVSCWLAGLDETMLARLRAAGLADGVGLASMTLGAFLARYMGAMAAKPATRTFYGHTRRNLETYFGTARAMKDIHEADADEWRAWLASHEKLSPATIARRVIAARTMWKRALRWKLASENPFAGIKAGHQENEARKHFVTRELMCKVMDQAPDAEWRCIIALARYGGLRCPSEVFALRWGDVDWDAGRFIVHSPKTEHHEGKGTRTVPIFPELRPFLLAGFEAAEPGTEHVVTRHRLGSANLRQQLERSISRAGLAAWPRLFQNLRASRETELMREYDLSTVCKWIGNSPTVAAKHYAMSVDLNADFRRASTPVAEPAEAGAVKCAGKRAEVREWPTRTGDDQRKRKRRSGKDLFFGSHRRESAGSTARWALQDSNL